MKDPRYPFALELGTEVAGYRIVEVLGAGGFGITYKGFNDVTHKTVAIKEFYVRDISSRTGSTVVVDTAVSEGTYEYALAKFQEEAKAVVNRFQHRYIIRGENFVKFNNTCYLVMEYVEGVNLEQWLAARSSPPTETELRKIFEKVFEAVDYVHDRNTMHRDLTPRNIMIRPNGDPVLIDFGAAGQGIDRDRSSKMVAQMRYAPPEQTDSDGPGQHGRYTDLYSLGAVFYRSVTGAPPIASVTRVMRMGRRGGSGLDPYVPAAEGALQRNRYSDRFLHGIDAALRLDEHERPQTITELKVALGWGTPEEEAAIGSGAWRRADDGSSHTVGFSQNTAYPTAPLARPPAGEREARRNSKNVTFSEPLSDRVSVVVKAGSGAKVVVSDGPSGPVPPPEPKRRSAMLPIAAVLVALLAAAGAIWAFVLPRAGEPGPVAGAYGLTAVREGGSVRLTGFAPSETDRQTLQEAVARAVAGGQVTNQLRIADGAPAGFVDMARHALGSIGDLATGTVKIEGPDVSIEGTAASPDTYRTLLRDHGRPLPAGWRGRLAVRPAEVLPFTFGADLEPGRVVLTGHVPDEATRTRVLDAARRSLPGQALQDDTKIASGADPRFADLVAFALERAAELSFGRVALSGTDVRVEGRARSPEAYSSLTTATVPGGSVTADVRPPLVQPFDFALVIEPDSVVMTGFVPSAEARADLAATATRAARGRTVRDETRIADGEPAEFRRAARFIIEQIPHVLRGRLALSGRNITADGQIVGPADFMELAKTLAPNAPGLPPGFAVERNTVGAPRISPYPWTATLAAGAVRLSGFVPSEAAREELLQAARGAVGTLRVDDEMMIGDGAPNGFMPNAKLGLQQMARLASGSLAIRDNDLTVTGTAASPEAYAAVVGDLGQPIAGGVRPVLSGLAPAAVAPFIWAAETAQGRLRLTGYVPDEATRTRIRDRLRSVLPQAAVTDQTLVAAGAPPAFAGMADYAAGRLVDLAEGKASLAGTEIRLEGRAASHDAYQTTARLDRQPLPAGDRLVSEIKPAVAAPFEWAATSDAQSVALTGFVPSEAAKAELAEAARQAARGRVVRDDTRIADGAPAEFMAAARTLADHAGRLQTGRAALRDLTLNVEGRAVTSADYEAIRRAAAAPAPNGYRFARLQADPPRIAPYQWAITVGPGSARLTGYVPTDAARRDAQALAATSFGASAVGDELQIGDGAPEQFGSALRYAVGLAGRLGSGRVALEDNQITIEGTASSPESHAALLKDLGRPLGGTTIRQAAITPAAVATFTFGAGTGTSPTSFGGVGQAWLSGYVPSEPLRQQIAEQLRRGVPGVSRVNDRLDLARNAPPAFAELVAFGIAHLPELSEGARFAITESEIRFEGRAKSFDVYEALMALVRQPAPGGARVTMAIRPPVASPFDWSVVVEPGTVTLTGAVPSEDVRRELVAAAGTALAGRTLRDEQRVADGAPQDFGIAARVALEHAQKLARGRINLADRSFSVDGQSAGPEAYDALKRATMQSTLPQGFRVGRFSVNAPSITPYTWNLIKNGSDVRLTGFMPSEAIKRELVAQVSLVPGWKVSEDLQIGDGAPERFLDTVRLMLGQALRLETGSIAISDGAVAIEGSASSPDAHASILQDLSNPLPTGGRPRVDVRPATVAPFTWSAKIERGAVRLSGYVPSEDERRRIVDALKTVLPRGLEVRDDTKIAAGAGSQFHDATGFALARVAELGEGSAVVLSDATLRFTGTARSPESLKSFNEAVELAALPAGLSLDHAVEAPKAVDAPPVRTDREREKAERDRQEREQVEREKAEREKAERDRAERDKAAREKADRERAERAEREKAEKADRERQERAAEREKQERAAADRERQERAAERDKQERAAAEREKQERAAAERERQERAERAAAERERQERAAAERERQERAAAERERQERTAERERDRERAAAERERERAAERERDRQERARRAREERRKAPPAVISRPRPVPVAPSREIRRQAPAPSFAPSLSNCAASRC